MSNFILVFILVAAGFFLLGSLGNSLEEHREEEAEFEAFREKYIGDQEYRRTSRELIPVRSKENGKWGLMNRAGYMVVPQRYLYILEKSECGGCWECTGEGWDETDYYNLYGRSISAQDVEEERRRIEEEKQAAERRAQEEEELEEAVTWAWIAHEYLKAEEEAQDDDDW